MTNRSSSKRILAEPLSAAEFAPFGELLRNDGTSRRTVYRDATKTGEGQGELQFSVSHVEPVPGPPVSVTVLERHPYSAQTFVPLKFSRWLIIVAPESSDGFPDVQRLRAFLAQPGQGISYRRGTWHHGTTVLDSPGQFGVLMWRRSTDDDSELYPLKEAIEIAVP